MKPSDFKVGQVVYAKTSRRHAESKNLAITKIARKWVYLENGDRFDPETMRTDDKGYSSMYTIYLSEAVYKETVGLQERWQKLRTSMVTLKPKHITAQDMDTLERIIKGVE